MAKAPTARKSGRSRTRIGSISPRTAALSQTPFVRPQSSFPVVAIGASAGGLAAFTALLKALPSKTGMAFVLIQHLEPKHESALATSIEGDRHARRRGVRRNGRGGRPRLRHPPQQEHDNPRGNAAAGAAVESSGLQRPIDDFCIALAEEQGNAAIGVVLSGTGSDGT